MKNAPFIAAVLGLALAGCTTAPPDLEPLPGSIHYGGRATPLRKAPPGSIHHHRFLYQGGMVFETYRVGPDRNLVLLDRRFVDDWPPR
ncbi:hypothetical protein [Ensifer soli]|uniref:hypothetical protein n=1 Tax=Ciceribacter sp. sgz301302 TaxID=3342379 RepID=UPI0035B9BFE4